jgi:D-alanyl-lipoteichoic acid acyltransferase DltB (MBOAT superfamily)
LGGSRCEKLKIVRNIFIVWGISGLWHGANWTFVIWGLFHACLLVLYIFMGINTKYEHEVAYKRSLPKITELFQMTITFFLAVLGWIIFRAKDMSQAYNFIHHMFGTMFDGFHISFEKSALYMAVLLLLVEWIQRGKQHALQFSKTSPFNIRPVRWIIYLFIIVLIACLRGHSQTFIYFQF